MVVTTDGMAVEATGELPVFSMAAEAVLGGAAAACLDKLDIAISFSVVSSCVLGFPKQDSRSKYPSSLRRLTLRAPYIWESR